MRDDTTALLVVACKILVVDGNKVMMYTHSQSLLHAIVVRSCDEPVAAHLINFIHGRIRLDVEKDPDVDRRLKRAVGC